MNATAVMSLVLVCSFGLFSSSANSSAAAKEEVICADGGEGTFCLDMLPEFAWSIEEAYQAKIDDGSLESFGVADVTWQRSQTEEDEKITIVTVAFKGGNQETWELIEKTAKEWSAHSSTFEFDFRNSDSSFRQWPETESDIKIGFNEVGYWAYMGRLALAVEPDQSTMNLQGFPQKLQRFYNGENAEQWQSSYYRTVILHEFGHALGLAHEHFHPDCQTDLNEEAVLAYFRGAPNYWSERTIRHNLFTENFLANTKYFVDQVDGVSKDLQTYKSQVIDQKSVMLYSLPTALMNSGEASVCLSKGNAGTELRRFPTELSEGDISYFQTFYGN